MTETSFRKLGAQFLNDYWGAFHEALEAQSVTPRRLAGSLFDRLQAEHRAFEEMYAGRAEAAVRGLGEIWRETQARRYRFPDPALTQEQVGNALRLFGEIYDSLADEGKKFPDAWNDVRRRAPHGTPRDPLRADTAR